MAEIPSWRVLREKLLLDRPPWLRVVEQDVVLPDGSTLSGFLLSQVRDYAMIFALTPDGRIPLVHQYKHGLRGPAYDLPAGYLDPGEDALACARRELLEETGYRSEQWISLGNYVRDGNRGGGSVYVFLALDAEKVAEPDSRDLEESQVHHLKMKDLLGLIRNQQIEPVGVVAAVLLANLYLEANKERNS